jgi:hypothetical protein
MFHPVGNLSYSPFEAENLEVAMQVVDKRIRHNLLYHQRHLSAKVNERINDIFVIYPHPACIGEFLLLCRHRNTEKRLRGSAGKE